ncbi:MAG: SpoIIE family protein phosphatase [Butyrivibrio sp.]|nr:SpoIIE family protein phosphatase [Butyrivibrio sp.]MBP3196002.1 SpoIIE family protein phosphatase [Butyrivibrio sp.]
MLAMIIKMSCATILYILLTAIVYIWIKDKKIDTFKKIEIGLIYGAFSVLSTHYGISYENMIINLRDLGPLAAGLFFSPASGIIAGLIGGIERYIAGTYWGISSYTRIACSVSTCLAGFVATAMNLKVFRGKKPSPFYAFFMGAVMEVFHMYVVFITHRSDMRMAFLVVKTCSIPMIIFTGLGLSLSSIMLQIFTGEFVNPFVKHKNEEIPVSLRFQRWLFTVTSLVIVSIFIFSYILQSRSAYQNSCLTIERSAQHVKERILGGDTRVTPENDVDFDIIDKKGDVIEGTHKGFTIDSSVMSKIQKNAGRTVSDLIFEERTLNRIEDLYAQKYLIVSMTEEDVYWYRDAQAYETGLADILLFTVIYVLIAFLVNQIVVNNIKLINNSLSKITNGNLNEIVSVRSSSEFASLSDDINQTVLTLKGYIDAAEKRIEQELIAAKTIQESALPKNFTFPGRDEFELFASMKPAKQVGGDFYDFFFVSGDKIALVIADVSGKGIPAALFMMRSKTAIRNLAESGGTPSEILFKVNNTLCDGNDAEMFVTVWIGILDMKTGIMKCANAGHEYPAIMRAGGEYELFKDKHSIVLAAMENSKAKEYELTLNPGDKLFVYTDGIPEAINEAVEQYGTTRMLSVLNECKDKSVTATLPIVSESVNRFKGNADQFDDITMLGFEFKKYMK